jgi:malate synthase
MNKPHEKATTRTEKTKTQPDNIPTRQRTTGSESKSTEYQCERNAGTHSQKPSIICSREAVIGGILDYLISEFNNQVDTKELEISRLSDEVEKIKSKIKEFEALKLELQSEQIEQPEQP